MIKLDLTDNYKRLLKFTKDSKDVRNDNYRYLFVIELEGETHLATTNGRALMVINNGITLDRGIYRWIKTKDELLLEKIESPGIQPENLEKLINENRCVTKEAKVWEDVSFPKKNLERSSWGISSFINQFPIALDYKLLELMENETYRIVFNDEKKPIWFETDEFFVFLMGILKGDNDLNSHLVEKAE